MKKVALFALIVGLIYILPHILFIWEEGRDYHLFFKPYTEETQFYAVRVRETYDSNYFSSDPYIFENKTRPYIRPSLAEYIVGSLGKISGLSIDNLFIWGDFIWPIIVFYFLFYFLNLLVHSEALSLLGAMAILLAEFPDSLTALLKLCFPDTLILTFTRPIHPQFSYIFFIACLIFIYKSLINDKIVYILLSGFFLGLLFYIYPFFSIYIFAGLTLLFLYSLLKRQFKQIKIISFVLIGALILSIPFWINWLKLMHLPFYNEVATRTIYSSHQPFILKLSPVVLLIFIIFYKRRDFNFLFLLSFLLGSLLCMNQQILTGLDLGACHWYFYADKQMAVVIGIVLLDNFLKRKRFRERFIKFFLIIGLTFSICMGIVIQLFNYENRKYPQYQEQYLYDAFAWLQNHTKRDDVVLASNSVSLLIPVYTHNNVYWSGAIAEYANSDKDLLERFFLLARLFGMNENEVINYISTNKNAFFGTRYEAPSAKEPPQVVPQDVYDCIKQGYRIFRNEDIKVSLMHFRADYLFYGPDEKLLSKGRFTPLLRAGAGFKEGSFLDKVYNDGRIQIYKIIR